MRTLLAALLVGALLAPVLAGAQTNVRVRGTLVALEVHYLAPNVPAGFGPWDLEPNSTMTNANVVAKVQETGRRELTLRWKDGERRIVVPEAAPIVRAVPGSRADLVPGEYVFVSAQQSPDGAITAQRIQVSRNGVRPPQ